MSAAICWRPVSNTGTRLSIGAPSLFMDMFERAGKCLPTVLEPGHVELLLGMKAGTNNKDFQDAIEELIEAIETHGIIELKAYY